MGMTREESIVMQKAIRDNLHETGKDYPYRDDMIPLMKESCNVAIKALEQQPCEDAVSREKAKQFLYERLDRLNDNELYDIFSRIIDDMYNELPSVKPATDNNVLTCEDSISRQAAIDCLNADFTIDGKENMETVVDYISGAFKQIKALPSVTSQQRVGHWIMKHRTYNKVKHYTGQDEMGETHTISVLERYEVDEPYCSKCGKLAGDTSQDFCCACGAKMVEPYESEG